MPIRWVEWLRNTAALIVAAALRFYRDDCLTRASALAYVSLLSVVPLLAVVFAVLKGLGVPRKVEPAVLARLAIPPETMATIMSAIERLNVGVLGALGAVLLLTTVVGLLGAIEAALDGVWRAQRGRGGWRRIREHLGLVLLTPFLLLAAIAITSSHHLGHMVRVAEGIPVAGQLIRSGLLLVPIALNVAGILVLYVVLPNRKPNWRAVLVGALVAGLLWQLVQWLYVSLQIGVARYNAVYGALAQLPITLVWLHASWIVFLFGAECAAVCEFGRGPGGTAMYPRSVLAIQFLRCAWHAFEHGGGKVDTVHWARKHNVAVEVAEEIARVMTEWGWLAVSPEGARDRYVLGSAPRTWDLARLTTLDYALVPGEVDSVVARLWAVMQEKATQQWKDLLEHASIDELFPGALPQVANSSPGEIAGA
ncbi:MAG: YihY/virulence factor BrkB family protein [Candidatus Binatia bacterium]|nr:YihY/virulence factor BrkB family protein [Candidatus Binatia bacterium]